MATDSRELLALALALEADGVDDEQAVASLVESAGCSAIALMGAYAFALSLARDMPFDTSNERTLRILTQALQQAVRLSGERLDADETAGLLQHIVEVSGQGAVAPRAVASRTAELEADLGHLRHDDEVDEEPSAAS